MLTLLVWQFLFSLNILSFWAYDVTNFPKGSRIMSPPICYFRFLIFVPETFKFEWQCSQYLELNLTCEHVLHNPGGVREWGQVFTFACMGSRNTIQGRMVHWRYASFHFCLELRNLLQNFCQSKRIINKKRSQPIKYFYLRTLSYLQMRVKFKSERN